MKFSAAPACLLTVLAVASPILTAQTRLAEQVWSYDLTDSESSGLGTVSISPGGATIMVDVLRQTMRFTPERTATPVTRAIKGRVIGWIADTAMISMRADRMTAYTADGTLRRIVPVTFGNPQIRGDGTALPGEGQPRIEHIGPGDTVAVSAAVDHDLARDPGSAYRGIDRIIWWQTSGGQVLGDPLAIPQTDCVVTVLDRDKHPVTLPPPYCSGSGMSAVAMPGRRLALIDAPQRSGADGSFSLIILTSSGDTLLAKRFQRPPRLITDSMWQWAVARPIIAAGGLHFSETSRPAVAFPVVGLRAAPKDGVWIRLASDGPDQEWLRVDGRGDIRATLHLPNDAQVIRTLDRNLITASRIPEGRRIVAWRAPD